MREANPPPPPVSSDGFWRPLLHRWLVEYNPLYILSAMLVLGGMILISRGLAREGSLYGQIGVAAIAELYSVALVASAALLTRIGQRRPAVMLAILTVLYQWDLTLHTEACANLGAVGVVATVSWLALFVAKLHGLAWALRLRVARRIVASAVVGALGLALFPYCFGRIDTRIVSALVSFWLLALFSLHRADGVTSRTDLDAWGQTVLRRALRTAWALSAVLLVLHVVFWAAFNHYQLGFLVPVIGFAFARQVRSETASWGATAGVLAGTALALPAAFSTAALGAAIVLALRGVTATHAVTAATATGAIDPPYRTGPTTLDDRPPVLVADLAAQARFFVGSGIALYLSIWTVTWSSGPWPAHSLPLDAIAALVVVLVTWRLRVRLALLPLAASSAHLVVTMRLIPAPHSLLAWGVTVVGIGFVLLLGSIAASYVLRSHGARATPESS